MAKYKINPKLREEDRPWIAKAALTDIEKLKNELMRLIRMPYRSADNVLKIRGIDKQIEYLEEVLAAFERDEKKYG